MRTGLLIFVLFLALAFFTLARKPPSVLSTPANQDIATNHSHASAPARYSTLAPSTFSFWLANPASENSATVDFARQVRPILEGKCQPCHFNGGTMYERLPFDRPETIRTLGNKLFTRIKDESERRVIREFLAQE
jgi:hypothetical protein